MFITSLFGWGTPLVEPPITEAVVTEEVRTEEVSAEGITITNESEVITNDTNTTESAQVQSSNGAAVTTQAPAVVQKNMWIQYKKPSVAELKATLDPITFKVTQNNGTERPGSSPLDKIWEPGIFVDILSGEPLYSSKDKFDSGTGWPSFTKPIKSGVVTEHEDNTLFSKRTEIRSTISDNHLGHVFTDGPRDSTGLRYCMNGVALRFVPRAQMEASGYGDYLQYL